MDILWLYKDKQKQNKLGNCQVIIGRIAAKTQLTEAKLQRSKDDPPHKAWQACLSPENLQSYCKAYRLYWAIHDY